MEASCEADLTFALSIELQVYLPSGVKVGYSSDQAFWKAKVFKDICEFLMQDAVEGPFHIVGHYSRPVDISVVRVVVPQHVLCRA